MTAQRETDLIRNVVVEVDGAGTDVWDLALEAAVVGQDVHRIVGPTKDLGMMSGEELAAQKKAVLEHLELEFEPARQGDLIVSRPSWCRSGYLFEAIAYHFEADEITSPDIVRYLVDSVLVKLGELGVSAVAMNLLGAEHGAVSDEDFLRALREGYRRYAVDLGNLTRIVLVPRKPERAADIERAVEQVLG